ncbi:hypothetical protein HZA39_01590 [Candidatus Peregrinibacteria bacterium]|nr:hypothetical protein [Candidatus Peregrinibacteria bacterium]
MKNIERFEEDENDYGENPEENIYPKMPAYISVRDAGWLKRFLQENLKGKRIRHMIGKHKVANVMVDYSKDYPRSLHIKIVSESGKCWTGSLEALFDNYLIFDLMPDVADND